MRLLLGIVLVLLLPAWSSAVCEVVGTADGAPRCIAATGDRPGSDGSSPHSPMADTRQEEGGVEAREGAAVTPPRIVEFGGTGRFDVYFPVRGPGRLEAHVEWQPEVECVVMLFSPGQKTPVAKTTGEQVADLAFEVGAASADQAGAAGTPREQPVEAVPGVRADAPQPQGPQDWMLQVVPRPAGAAVEGTLALRFPGSDSALVLWRPYRPSTALGRAALATYLRAARRAAAGRGGATALERKIAARVKADPEVASELEHIAHVCEAMPAERRGEMAGRAAADASLEPLDLAGALAAAHSTPAAALTEVYRPLLTGHAGTLQADSAEEPERPAESVISGPDDLPARLQVLFNHMLCLQETDRDPHSDSDEVYCLLGLVREDGTATAAVSEALGGFDRGDAHPAPGVAAYDQIWEGEITGDTYCIIALVEHDWSTREGTLKKFVSALEDAHAAVAEVPMSAWDVGEAGPGAGARAVAAAIASACDGLLGWAASTIGDRMIGRPVGLLITRDSAAAWSRGPGHVWSGDFRGQSGHYGLLLTFGERVAIAE